MSDIPLGQSRPRSSLPDKTNFKSVYASALSERLSPHGAGQGNREPAAKRSEPANPDRAAVAKLIASKEELSLRLGGKILTVGYGTRGQRRLVVAPLAACAETLLTSDNGGAYKRKPAWIENGGADEAAAAPAVEVVPPGARVARLMGAQICAGVVTTADGRTVAESLPPMQDRERFGPFAYDRRGLYQVTPRFSVQRRLRGAPAVMLKQPGDVDYGRWLTEGLPRLALIEDHFDLRRLSFIVSAADDPMQGIFEDSLALFGIGPEQIIEAGDETLAVDDLIYPAPLARAPGIFAPRCIEVLEQIATRVRAAPAGFKRLYVTSTRTAKHRLLNEAAVIAVVKRHGFTVVEPEGMSLYQQIGLFRQARVVVGNHAAALTNAMFSTEDLTLFALTANAVSTDPFVTLMSLKEGRYIALEGEAKSPATAADSGLTIDIPLFERMLAGVLDPSSR